MPCKSTSSQQAEYYGVEVDFAHIHPRLGSTPSAYNQPASTAISRRALSEPHGQEHQTHSMAAGGEDSGR